MTVQEARQLCLINKLPPTDENVKMFILQREGNGKGISRT
jgi:hypothetical protein